MARRIITACPSLYASIRDTSGTAAVGRLALVEDCGGIYCMAVRPDARRRGHAMAVLRALLEQASHLSIARVWLQAVAGNRRARALYARAGFIDASTYHYRRLSSQ
ncbi:MAG: GNAT family N-acetyltransferase [Acidimicrobiales bacterium]